MHGVANYITAYSIAPYGFLWACRDIMQRSFIPELWAHKEHNRVCKARLISIVHYKKNENQPRS